MLAKRNFLLLIGIICLGILTIGLGIFVFSLQTKPVSHTSAPGNTSTSPSVPTDPFTFTDDLGRPVKPGFTIQYSGNKTFSFVGILKDIFVQNNNLFATIYIQNAGQDSNLHFLLLTPNTYLFLYTTHISNVFGINEQIQPVKLLKGDSSPIAKQLATHKNQEVKLYISLFVLHTKATTSKGAIGQDVIKEISDHLNCDTSLFQSLTATESLNPNCTYYSNYLTVYEKN